ncbi:M20 family metallopeptidase [Microbacterium sp. NPDC076768]|uniref:M20 family metallopeptidase n=1 Tax=Microbacterium sp. NPDC076768 TaxID=3154858 RepID=UPI00343E4330
MSEAFDDERALATLIEDIRAVVECESPSSDDAAVSRSADVIAALGESRLGAVPERMQVDGCSHLRWRFGTGPRRVVVLCHHDTVWPLGSLAERPFLVKDGVLQGPGCFDMKTGLVMGIHAVAALENRDGVSILITGDEEIGSPRSRSLIEAEARGASAVFVLEASADGGALKTQRKGVSLYRVHLHGRAAHAGLEPHKGANATIELAHQVLAVNKLGDAEHETTVTVTTAGAGTTANTIAAHASFAVDVRATSEQEQQRVDAALRALMPVISGVSIEIDGGINRPPLERSASEGLFARAQKVNARLGYAPLDAVAVGGASDGNFTAGVGTPTLDGLGAIGGGAHAPHEHVLTAQLVERTRLLSALIVDVCADVAGGAPR